MLRLYLLQREIKARFSKYSKVNVRSSDNKIIELGFLFSSCCRSNLCYNFPRSFFIKIISLKKIHESLYAELKFICGRSHVAQSKLSFLPISSKIHRFDTTNFLCRNNLWTGWKITLKYPFSVLRPTSGAVSNWSSF